MERNNKLSREDIDMNIYTEDLCKDHKLKFGIKTYKLLKGDYQIGLFINRQEVHTYCRPFYEKYLYISFFKWTISVGWFCEVI